MKFILALLMLLAFTSAFAQETEVEPGNETEIEQEVEPTPTPEQERESIKLRCNVIKTPWYLNKSYDHASKVTKCWFNRCRIKNIRKAELNFCKAVNSCETLETYLENPCTDRNELTPEAKENAKDGILALLHSMGDASVIFVSELIEDARNRN